MTTLIAVTSCHAFRTRADAIRETWAPEVKDADVRFFLGTLPNPSGDSRPDEILLPVPDGYHFLSQKTQLIRRWALEHGYDYLWKVDDDVYLRPERLKVARLDYVGRVRGPSGNYRAPYCSGFCYGMTRRALELIAPIDWNASDDFSEDRWVGNQLLAKGITPRNEPNFVVHSSKNNTISGREAPLVDNQIIASCEYNPVRMRSIHQDFKNGLRSTDKVTPQPKGSLSRVAVMIKTFLRDGYLAACLTGLERNFPDCKLVIMDDGYESREKIAKYSELRRRGHSCEWLPFDSGFGEKANAAIQHCDRDYVLIGSDDFDFSDPRVRSGVEAMVKVLDGVPSLGLVSGRVDSRPYEFTWEQVDGGLREVKKFHASGEVNGAKYHLCDLTVNYSLIRRKVFEAAHGDIRWDGGEVKIGGGEHSAFFIDLQRTYWGVAYVEGANVNQFKFNPQWQMKDYHAMRARARVPGRPCLKRRGISKYILADGTVEIS
jgi:hypothetical protein